MARTVEEIREVCDADLGTVDMHTLLAEIERLETRLAGVVTVCEAVTSYRQSGPVQVHDRIDTAALLRLVAAHDAWLAKEKDDGEETC